MGKNREMAEYFLELCRDVPEKRLRAMFGGHGLYSGDAMFGLEAFGELYLKADESSKAAFQEAGAKQFVYEGSGGKKSSMNYWAPPAEILEDPDAFQQLLSLSLEAAEKAFQSKKKKK